MQAKPENHGKPARIPRVHARGPLSQGAALALDESAAHHLAVVLRMRAGDDVILFDGSGGEFQATITSVERGRVSAQIGAHTPVERESPLEIVLVQGISSGERMDFTVQKSVELGVSAIVPLICEKSVVRLNPERALARQAHWQRVVNAACEQCGRNRIPEVLEPLTLARYCGLLRDEPQTGAIRLLLDPEANASLKEAASGVDTRILLAAGPEAGYSATEVDMLLHGGFRGVRIGPRILRTETAALAAIAALGALRGDF